MKKQIHAGLFCASAALASACGSQEDFARPNLYEYHGLDAYGPIPADLSDRFLTCPVNNKILKRDEFNGKSYVYKSAAEVDYGQAGWETRVAADWNALKGLVPDNMEIVVIDIRRVLGVPHYLYLSNGRHSELFEPWSSAKFLAASAAMTRARTESSGLVGGDGSVDYYNIGDLVTALTTYKAKGNAPGGGSSGVEGSNGIGNYFFRVAGAEYLTDLLHDRWLKLSDASRFRSGFGGATFDERSDHWTSRNGGASTLMRRISGGLGDSKVMSALAQAEWLKRLTQYETEPGSRMPGFNGTMDAEDVRALFYGNLNRTNEIGGMLAGESVYMIQGLLPGMPVGTAEEFNGQNNALAKGILDKATDGKWRIYHKLGAGYSDSRGVGEVVMAAYACLPQFDGGREFVIVTSAHGSNLGIANAATTKAFRSVVPKLISGFTYGSKDTACKSRDVADSAYRYELTANNDVVVRTRDNRAVATVAADYRSGEASVLAGKNIKIYFDAVSGTGNRIFIYTEAGNAFLAHDGQSKRVPLNCRSGVLK